MYVHVCVRACMCVSVRISICFLYVYVFGFVSYQATRYQVLFSHGLNIQEKTDLCTLVGKTSNQTVFCRCCFDKNTTSKGISPFFWFSTKIWLHQIEPWIFIGKNWSWIDNVKLFSRAILLHKILMSMNLEKLHII